MASTASVSIQTVGALKSPITLYVDDSYESSRARECLEVAGVTAYITDGPIEPLERKPLAIYRGGIYQGLTEIESLLTSLAFWRAEGVPGLFQS